MDNRYRFGKLRNAYASGRKGYSKECMEYISSLVFEGVKVLDLGCGTGISTRQLADVGFSVVGLDSDEKMLEKAKEENKKNISYINAEVSKMPFDNEEFQVITAFGAFHWFRDQESTEKF